MAKTNARTASTKMERMDVAAPHVTEISPLPSISIHAVIFSISKSESMAYSGRMTLYFAANRETSIHH